MASKKEKKELQKLPEKKESKSEVEKTIERIQSVFNKAIVISLLAHTPLMVGSFYPRHEKPLAPVAILSKEGVTEFTKPKYVENIEQELEQKMTDEEVQEFMDQISEEALEGYEKAKMAVKMRQEERNKRIDAERIKQFKLELNEKLKNGERIDFPDFVFKTEEIIMGIEPAIIENAKEVFFKEVEELKKIKPAKPTREFLNKIVSYTEEDEKGPAYELTSTSVSVYLDRKSKGKRGNCQARARYTAMLLQEIYPERWNNVYFQETGNHIRTLFEIDDVFYMMEPGTAPLTEKMKEGTMIYKPNDVIRMTAGEKITAEVEEVKNKERMKNKKKGLPIITDNTAFPSPKPDKELINQGRDASHLYKKRFEPPEVTRLELDKPKPTPEQKKQKEQFKRQYTGTETVEFHTIKNKKGEIVETLPWEPSDIPAELLTERIHGFKFNGALKMWSQYNTTQEPIINPSKETIKRLNNFKLKHIVFGNAEHFSQEALEELFKGETDVIEFQLKHSYMPLALYTAVTEGENFKKFPNQIIFSIERETEDFFGNPGDAPNLSKQQLEAIINGKGGLVLDFRQRKNFDREEIKMYAKSSRPYISVRGNTCNLNTEALIEMADSTGCKLLLNDSTYLQALLENPKLLENEFVMPEIEYFGVENTHLMQHMTSNSIQNIIVVKEKMIRSGASAQALKRLENIEKLMLESINLPKVHLDEAREKAQEKIENNEFELTGSMGACQMPENDMEAEILGKQTKELVSEAGIPYTLKYDQAIYIENGIEFTQNKETVVTLLNGKKIAFKWVDYNTIQIYEYPQKSKATVYINNERKLSQNEYYGNITSIKWVNDGQFIIMPDNLPGKFIPVKAKFRPRVEQPEISYTKDGLFYSPFSRGKKYEFMTDFTGQIRVSIIDGEKRTEPIPLEELETQQPLKDYPDIKVEFKKSGNGNAIAAIFQNNLRPGIQINLDEYF